MKLTNSQEEYLKTIYILEKSNKKIRVTDIANRLKITKPSVNKAIKNLKEISLVRYEAYGTIELTEEAKEIAKEIIKRQDILEMFLTEVLELDPKEASQEAIAMKHAISENTVQKLDKYISQILDLGNLDCNYDKNSEKCRKCVKITARNRMKNHQK